MYNALQKGLEKIWLHWISILSYVDLLPNTLLNTVGIPEQEREQKNISDFYLHELRLHLRIKLWESTIIYVFCTYSKGIVGQTTRSTKRPTQAPKMPPEILSSYRHKKNRVGITWNKRKQINRAIRNASNSLGKQISLVTNEFWCIKLELSAWHHNKTSQMFFFFQKLNSLLTFAVTSRL